MKNTTYRHFTGLFIAEICYIIWQHHKLSVISMIKEDAEICYINRSKFGSIISFLSLRDPVRVVFRTGSKQSPHLLTRLPRKNGRKTPIFARNDSCLTYYANGPDAQMLAAVHLIGPLI
jgi:hypothetical protein